MSKLKRFFKSKNDVDYSMELTKAIHDISLSYVALGKKFAVIGSIIEGSLGELRVSYEKFITLAERISRDKEGGQNG